MEEVWKEIKGYEGLYSISNKGRIMNIKRGRIKAYGMSRQYRNVSLCKNGKMKAFTVHRLVAEAFIPNPLNKDQVDHIDTNPLNNEVTNLRWCNGKENNRNPLTRVHKSQSKKGERNPFHKSRLTGERLKLKQEAERKRIETVSRRVKQVLGGEVISTYSSSAEASKATGICATNINRCCNGKRKTAGGYSWEFV